MAGSFSIQGQVDGLAAIVATLKNLPGKLERKVMRKGLSKATKPTLALAKRLVPKDSGLLKKSIGRKVATYKSGDAATLVVVIGPRRGFKERVARAGRTQPVLEDPANIAHLVEFGTKPHSTAKGAKSKAATSRPSGGRNPGTKPRPFLRPAFDGTKAEILRIFGDEVQAGLEAELLK